MFLLVGGMLLLLIAAGGAISILWVARALARPIAGGGRRRPARKAHPTVSTRADEASKARTRTALQSRPPTVDLTSRRGRAMRVVGESFYQEELCRIDSGRRALGETVAFYALVVPEPWNPWGETAIAIAVEGGDVVGHLASSDSIRYLPVSTALLGRGWFGKCEAWLIGGEQGKPTIGVMLQLLTPDACLKAIERAAGVANA
jgi:hypothetical protein